jgi:hypothetical protein
MMKYDNYDWDQIVLDFPVHSLADIEDNEQGVMDILIFMYQAEKLSLTLGVPQIAHAEVEFRLPKGVADMVLFHMDGSISVVEAKSKRTETAIAAGIGQLCMYAVQLGFSRTHSAIRKLLVAPVIGKDPNSLLLDMTCEAAGVRFIPLGTTEEHRDVSRGFAVKGLESQNLLNQYVISEP